MDELELRDFRHGGVNITGFNLIDETTSPNSQTLSAMPSYSSSPLTVCNTGTIQVREKCVVRTSTYVH